MSSSVSNRARAERGRRQKTLEAQPVTFGWCDGTMRLGVCWATCKYAVRRKMHARQLYPLIS
jgi:hypothetical protein